MVRDSHFHYCGPVMIPGWENKGTAKLKKKKNWKLKRWENVLSTGSPIKLIV